MDKMGSLDFEAMRSVDIRTVDSATLIDIRDIKVDSAKSRSERVVDFIRQIKNPYCFRCGDMIVKVSYSDDTTTMEERMESFFARYSL